MTAGDAEEVVVVGAGLFGAAVARECALRGLAVTLLEADEVASGASRVGLLLLGDGLPTGGDARTLSGLAALAPHLVSIVPVEGIGLGSVVDVTRLTQLYVLDAVDRGARVRIGTRVRSVEPDETDAAAGHRVVLDVGDPIRARAVVVATGASRLDGVDASDVAAREVRVLDVAGASPREGGLDEGALLCPTRNGARLLVPDASNERARAALSRVGLDRAPITDSQVVEVAVASAGREDAAPGLVRITESLPGAHRSVASFVADALARAAGRDLRALVREEPLLGGGALVRSEPLAEHYRVPDLAVERLISRHGTRTDQVLARTLRAPAERTLVCSCEAVLECELRHALRVEGARTLADVARRTTLGAGACHGLECAHRASQIVRSETGADASALADRAWGFVRARFEGRAPFLGPADLGREELALARLATSGGWRREES